MRSLLLGAVLACRRDGSPQASEQAAAAATPTAQPAAAGPRATRPNDGCGWIPVAEVEAILGKLAGPPKASPETCRYPLPMDAETAAKREQFKDMARRLSGPKSPAARDTAANSVAVVLSVDLAGDMTSEHASKVSSAILSNMLAQALGDSAGPNDSTKQPDGPKPPAGWDAADVIRGHSDFRGRVGHVVVSVEENGTMVNAVSAEKKAALAARVRDRLTDLPFAWPNPDLGPTPPPSGPDPCSLITREEAESALGKLVAAPYRSKDGGPYAKPNGNSCAYYTSGHHVLVMTPSWTRGKHRFAIARGVGGLVGMVAPDPDKETADTLDGPWDDAQLGLDGALLFLKGDQMLEVGYLTSSTPAAGAVRLARIALGRLATSSPRP